MKEYDVKITETLEKTVTVEAKSRADAEEQVRSAYYNSEYILDSENFTGVELGLCGGQCGCIDILHKEKPPPTLPFAEAKQTATASAEEGLLYPR